ncbi:MAG TPA: tRNA (cytidine(34)-2'-O)-methyltransferase [Devosiaceae bacterium]
MTAQLALYQPDIPQNTGTLIRLAACLDFTLHVIHPTGFNFSDRQLRRAGMDYVSGAEIVEHDSFEAFDAWRRTDGRRLVLLTTKANASVYGTRFTADDVLLVGRESAGVPDDVAVKADLALRIPMAPHRRSLNVAIAAAMAMGEALRQTGGMARW